MIFDRDAFPFTKELEENWETIRDEALRVTAEPERLPRLQEISSDNKKIAGQGIWRIFFWTSRMLRRGTPSVPTYPAWPRTF